MPLYAKLPRKFALGLEAAIPITLTLVVIALALLTIYVTHRFAEAADESRQVACIAVDRSNDKTFLALHKQFTELAPEHQLSESSLRFLSGIREAYDDISKDCRLNLR